MNAATPLGARGRSVISLTVAHPSSHIGVVARTFGVCGGAMCKGACGASAFGVCGGASALHKALTLALALALIGASSVHHLYILCTMCKVRVVRVLCHVCALWRRSFTAVVVCCAPCAVVILVHPTVPGLQDSEMADICEKVWRWPACSGGCAGDMQEGPPSPLFSLADRAICLCPCNTLSRS